MKELVFFEEELWFPVTESGEEWVGRSKAEARRQMRDWPAGGRYPDGQEYDGIVRLIRRTRWVSNWKTEGGEGT